MTMMRSPSDLFAQVRRAFACPEILCDIDVSTMRDFDHVAETFPQVNAISSCVMSMSPDFARSSHRNRVCVMVVMLCDGRCHHTEKQPVTSTNDHKHASCVMKRDDLEGRSVWCVMPTFREASRTTHGPGRKELKMTTTQDGAAERHVLDTISGAGKPLTITDIASRLFADPLRVTPVVIEMHRAGKLTKHSEAGPTSSITIVTYGLPEMTAETGEDRADVNAPAVGRASAYPTKGRQELARQIGAERIREP